jgi:hypothetical protein
LLYPAPPARRLLEADVKIPVLESVVEIYGEAATAAAAGALRAAAVMYRAAVEAICDALDVPTTAPMKNGSGEYTCKLYDRIDELRSRSIDDDLVTDRHEARMMGNDSVHAGSSTRGRGRGRSGAHPACGRCLVRDPGKDGSDACPTANPSCESRTLGTAH